jgi:hypothetical protein
MERVSREAWAKRVERWRESGLTAAEYAAEIGVRPQTLSWWKWRLASLGQVGTVAQRRQRKMSRNPVKAATVSPLTFVEMRAPAPGESLEVVLPTSFRICVRPDFDAATLARLLDVLEARR